MIYHAWNRINSHRCVSDPTRSGEAPCGSGGGRRGRDAEGGRLDDQFQMATWKLLGMTLICINCFGVGKKHEQFVLRLDVFGDLDRFGLRGRRRKKRDRSCCMKPAPRRYRTRDWLDSTRLFSSDHSCSKTCYAIHWYMFFNLFHYRR